MGKDKVVEAKRDVLSAYRLWLNNKVSNELSPAYTQVLAILWRTEYVAEYENDNNRIADGKTLRDEFATETKLDNVEYMKLKHTSIRLIEIMISLAGRINNISSFDDNVAKYFWKMVSSLGLNTLDDGHFNASSAQKRIDGLLKHTYSKNGRGSLFFIPTIDQSYNATKLDLWTQAMAYLNAEEKRNG